MTSFFNGNNFLTKFSKNSKGVNELTAQLFENVKAYDRNVLCIWGSGEMIKKTRIGGLLLVFWLLGLLVFLFRFAGLPCGRPAEDQQKTRKIGEDQQRL